MGEGKNLTDAFNEVGLCSDPDLGDKGGALAIMTGNRITRPDYTVQSIQMAILAMDPAIYRCSDIVPLGINAPLVAQSQSSRGLIALTLVGALCLFCLIRR